MHTPPLYSLVMWLESYNLPRRLIEAGDNANAARHVIDVMTSKLTAYDEYLIDVETKEESEK